MSTSVSHITQTLENWRIRIRATHKGYYRDASKLSSRQHILGTTVALISGVVGSGVLLSMSNPEEKSTWVIVSAGMLSILAAILSALQTYLNYPARQVTHVLAATKLSSLKKRIEERLAIDGNDDELKSFLKEIRLEWDMITHSAPLLSNSSYSKCMAGKTEPIKEKPMKSGEGEAGAV